MTMFQINRNHVEPEFSTLRRTIPEFISDGVLIPNPDWQTLAVSWAEFRRLEQLDAVQPAIEQGLKVKALLDTLAGWDETEDEDEDEDEYEDEEVTRGRGR